MLSVETQKIIEQKGVYFSRRLDEPCFLSFIPGLGSFIAATAGTVLVSV